MEILDEKGKPNNRGIKNIKEVYNSKYCNLHNQWHENNFKFDYLNFIYDL